MSLQACADLVARGDPDRFRAAMAAPVDARRVLFPLYAFNLEVARAPWVTQEPLIAEMRLQWWADALDEIAAEGPVRRHEVVTPLSDIVTGQNVAPLLRNVEARRRDARREVLGSAGALETYVAETAGSLMEAAIRALAPQAPDHEVDWVRKIGTASGLASDLLGVPDFLARGVNPLPEMSEAEFSALLRSALAVLDARAPSREARVVALAGWRARGILRRALADPAAVPEGRLNEAPILRDLALLWARRGL